MLRTFKNVVVWDSSSIVATICDVVTDGSIIASISPANTVNEGHIYDGRGQIALLPGFVNAHGHSAMTLFRGLAEELPLMEWLNKIIWPLEDKLTSSHVRAGTDLAITEMLSTGTTCFADMYFFMEQVAKAALDAEIKCCICRGIVNDLNGEKLNENLELVNKYNGKKKLLNVQLGPHAPYTVSYESMREIVTVALQNNLGIQLHWLETETEWCSESIKNEFSPEEYLSKTGLLNVQNLNLSHGVWIKERDVAFYNKDNITIIHNPKSNMKLGSGFSPLSKLLDNKVSVALGTDGAASNNRLDMWEEMKFAALIHKGKLCDPTTITATEVLKMATINGAKALGFNNSGLIKEGYDADMILINLNKPHYVGWNLENLPNYIVYAGSSCDIESTIVLGKTLYNRGIFKTMDLDAVLSSARKARNSLVNN